MADVIKLKRSSVAAAAPTAGQLALGELALNVADGKLFFKKADGSIVTLEQAGARPWTGAADFDAMTQEGIWIVDQAMANGPAQYPTPGAIVEVRRVDGGRIEQKLAVIYHNITLFRMLITWDAAPFWAQWQTYVTVDSWTPITSLLNGWTILPGFNSRFRILGGSLQLQLYATMGTKNAGTVFWNLPFLYRPPAIYPFNGRGDVSATAGQWSAGVAGLIDTNGDAKLGPAVGGTTLRFGLDVFIPLG
ncbi:MULTISPECIES: hypothetical protein [unclassified Pseudomonas]|uniref:hypothetical protein n=1 Tax=unclassified Pseudomonas TaxID=196821 RepID=UPI002447F5F6|nr:MULTISPECIES: hypothetical protein [unclassified Pseudomonas]MDG9928546.1 hypothetical protein [Pseudomonas sp. GD04042]MDH0482716.1 hypothetical protein [Pseudomonas sp. GD04015]MDH0604582.1 hypothetical protein [Pseudomonas sp. GD03869]